MRIVCTRMLRADARARRTSTAESDLVRSLVSGNESNSLDRSVLQEFGIARYCAVPFPAYHFTPGINPHPTAHREGHSFEGPDFVHPHVEAIEPGQWQSSEDYLFGCDLYNHAYWWEAHEAWEALWKCFDKDAPQRRFLQGLIQSSACHLKRFVGHGDGVQRLLASSQAYLQSVIDEVDEPIYMGLHVGDFAARTREYYDESALGAAANVAPHEPQRYPYIRLA